LSPSLPFFLRLLLQSGLEEDDSSFELAPLLQPLPLFPLVVVFLLFFGISEHVR